jgi:hypothetical protein
VKWNAFSVTAGVGWDFTVAKELVLRPEQLVAVDNAAVKHGAAGPAVGPRELDRAVGSLEDLDRLLLVVEQVDLICIRPLVCRPAPPRRHRRRARPPRGALHIPDRFLGRYVA